MYPIANPTYTTVDRLINQGPTLFLGCVINTSSDGGDVTLYDGDNADSGSKKLVLDGLAATSNPIFPTHPVLFDRGLFIDIGSNVTGVTVLWCSASPTLEQLTNP